MLRSSLPEEGSIESEPTVGVFINEVSKLKPHNYEPYP